MGDSSGLNGSDFFHLYSPVAMYYDEPNNVIIIGDINNQRVIQFSLDNLSAGGTVIAGTGAPICSSTQAQVPVGIGLDSYRQMYVTDPGCSQILRYPPNPNPSTNAVLIAYEPVPEVLHINPFTDDLYVAGYYYHRVLKFPSGSSTGIVVAGEYESFDEDF